MRVISLPSCFAAMALLATQAWAQTPLVTHSDVQPCPDSLGTIEGAVNPPKSFSQYAYFCMVRGVNAAKDGITYEEGCDVIKGGPFQAKFPASLEYQNSSAYKDYVQKLDDQCTTIDANAGVQGRFYRQRPHAAPLKPQKCILLNDKESCKPIR